MLNSICIWSGHISPSMISTPFHSHNFLSISRISAHFSSKNTLRRYLGANTIWYLQFHFVCAKLFVLSVSFDILDSSVCVFLLGCQTNPIITQTEVPCFVHRLTFTEPRDYRGVFVIQQARRFAARQAPATNRHNAMKWQTEKPPKKQGRQRKIGVRAQANSKCDYIRFERFFVWERRAIFDNKRECVRTIAKWRQNAIGKK